MFEDTVKAGSSHVYHAVRAKYPASLFDPATGFGYIVHGARRHRCASRGTAGDSLMDSELGKRRLDALKVRYPDKFGSEDAVFSHIHRGDRIFIGTGCGEPQYLVGALVRYVESHPKKIFDAEVFHVWTLGVAPYTDTKFRDNFRHNSFFVGQNTRDAVNAGLADYTPVFLSGVPELFRRGLVAMDVALVQTSLPDAHGYLSLGISVDIVKAAVEKATLVIAQVNAEMPRVLGDSFLHIEDVDFIVPHDEPLLEYRPEHDDAVAQPIGKYVARLIQDGDTIQVGYGSIPNAILSNLRDKKHLGVHTELFSDGIADLMSAGVIDNSQKTLLRGKTVAAFCMGKRETYDYLDDHPGIEFRSIDFTNNPLNIARNDNMVAINTGLEIDLTGQATAESLGGTFFSGVGGQADFMRGAVLARNGKAIFALPSTARDGEVSRVGVRHRPSVREERPSAGDGAHRHRAPEVPSDSHSRGEAPEPHLSGSGVHRREEGRISGRARNRPHDEIGS